MFRIGKVINNINTSEDTKVMLKLGKLIFFLILYVHVIGCFWFTWVKVNGEWIPPLDYMYVQTDLYESSDAKVYASCFYHAVQMLIGSEVGPRTIYQYSLISTVLIIGAIFNANIFGTLAVLVQ